MAYIELRGKGGLQQYTVKQLQHFTFSCINGKRDQFDLRLGLATQGQTVYFCISQSDKDIKTVPNGIANGSREQTTWKTFNTGLVSRLTPDDIDGLSKSDRKLYRQLLRQFIDTQEKRITLRF